MTAYLEIIEKSIWSGLAAIGFAILFNVPRRTIFTIWVLGALGGLIKFLTMHAGIDIVLASLLGATMIGFLSVTMAHRQKSPPLIFSIPSVIPMVPGAFAYNMMLGLIDLITIEETNAYLQSLILTVNNAAKMIFVLAALATGVAIPMLISRKSSVKKSKFN